MTNRGELKYLIGIWENVISDDKNELDEKEVNEKCVALVLAKKEFRGGGLLTGRPADTVLTRTTDKFTYVYSNFPNLKAEKNWITYRGEKYNILYTLNEGDNDEFLQVFTEKEVL